MNGRVSNGMWKLQDGLLRDSGLLDIGIRHFSTTKQQGDMKDGKCLRSALDKGGIDPGSLVTGVQVHGGSIRVLDVSDRGATISSVDGFILNEKGVSAGVFTADCVPVFIANRDASLAAVVHAGWKGVAAGIVENAGWYFREAREVVAGIGPHICGKCYNVGESFKEVFPGSYKDGRLDLGGEIRSRLLKLGIQENNISACEYCTYHNNDLLFSYRGGEKAQRLISVIAL